MKIKEIIEELRKLDGELDVAFPVPENMYEPDEHDITDPGNGHDFKAYLMFERKESFEHGFGPKDEWYQMTVERVYE